ncbi:SRPBCC family protein [Actinokineospora inagensis]|uniref:SRPBCC family protein n=1 Tax=Actinokineospora inagensis TaxID=103730 RepID=UPI000409B306|nr:SRPBCC domain-containing protein [Actinokineospora inagensis]
MTVISTHKDPEALTMTFVAEFAAPVERVWQVWQDPRQLERWWGPPTWPATFERHEFTVGGASAYHMSGPEGEKYRGWWRVTALDAPTHLEFDDGFADDDGNPNPSMPATHIVVTLAPADSGTRMTSVTRFPTLAALEQLAGMGMEEGMRLAMGQIDDILTA